MNWTSILKALPALLALLGTLFANRKRSPKRADDVLGEADEKTDAEQAKDKADDKADEKFGT